MWLLRTLLINSLLLVIFALSANAEGKIEKLHIKSTTVYRFNTVKIDQRIVNHGSTRDKLIFQAALPTEAFVTAFSMTIGKIHVEGRIIKQIRKALDSLHREPEKNGKRIRSTTLFRIIVHAPAGTICTFSLTYQNMLQRRLGVYDQTVYITPGQIVDDLQVITRIYETRDITNLTVLPVQMDQGAISLVGRSANITYKPTVVQQRASSESGINGLYTVNYDVQRAHDSGDIVLWNGYFLHFFAPSGLRALPKDVVFVLDDSTSMTGNKLKQMKNAIYEILDSLHENDRFHFVHFHHRATSRANGFVQATPANIVAAKDFVRKTFIARGATNINDAIIEGLKSFERIEYKPGARSSILMFLTDGRPTVGEKIPEKILKNIEANNKKNVQIFAISLGADADYSLMQRISYLNNGEARIVYEASDSARQLKYFFYEISSIIMKSIKFKYNSRSVLKDDIAWSKFKNYFEGSEIITAGKVSDYNMKDLGVTISSKNGGSRVDVKDLVGAVSISSLPSWMTSEEYKRTLERMWVFQILKYWMRLKIIGGSEQYLLKLDRKLQELAVKYHFMIEGATMSMDSDGTQGDQDFEISVPEIAWDLYGKALKRPEEMVFNDPHFMVILPKIDIPVCFEIIAERGDFLLLVEDPVSGVRVTSSVIESPTRNKDGRHKTYLGEVFISTLDLQVRISPREIRLNGLPLSWNLEKSLGSHHMRVVITGSGSHVSIIVNNSTQMLIQRYLYAFHNPKQVNYLNFYITDNTGLSPKTTGLLGYFVHANVNPKTQMKEGIPPPRTMQLTSTNRVTGKKYPLTANMIDRLDVFDVEHTVTCWKILPHENTALFGGTATGKFFLEGL